MNQVENDTMPLTVEQGSPLPLLLDFAGLERAEYDVVRGPFPSQEQAMASMDRLLARSNTPNAIDG